MVAMAAARGRRRAPVLALALVALLALGAPGLARADDADEEHDDGSGSSSSSSGGGGEAATPPPPPPPPARRAAGAKLAFAGEAAAYAGTDDDDKAKPSTAKASPGQPLLLRGAAAEVPAGAALSVAFQTTLGGKPATPQQAVLRLFSGNDDDSTPSAYVWARRRKGGDPGDLVVTVTHAEVERQIGRVPAAALAATLLVGDPSASAPQGAEWPLGEVRFAEAAAAGGGGGGGGGGGSGSNAKQQHQQQQAKLLTAAHQPLHNALPDIRHTFRRPERRAPAALSLAFTALALLPLVLLVPALLAAGANLKGWPSGGSSSSTSASAAAAAWATAFLASLAATLGLLVVFWLRLTLATFLWPAVALGSALWYTGWRALRAQAALRVAAEEEAGQVGGAKKKD